MPWDHILVDLIGELPKSNGSNAILIITNILSKLIIVVPTNMDLMACIETMYGASTGYQERSLVTGDRSLWHNS